jgi:hypothetical protein
MGSRVSSSATLLSDSALKNEALRLLTVGAAGIA